jgi:predicted dehydrogenase
MPESRFTRRHFFYGSLLAGAVPAAGFGSTPSLKMLGYKSPNEKLNIASIGAGGRAAADIRGCAPTENLVALCDVDGKEAAATFKQFEKATKYQDFRKMLDKEGRNIDAVVVAIPDFMHATAATWCMERGKHVYVEKPLTRTAWEARWLRDTAAKYKVATQMGNQGYSNEGTRQCAEMIWAGEIGDVTEVHAWTNRPVWPQGLTAIPAEDRVPDTLDWDLWQGVSAARPYTSGGAAYEKERYKFYQPFNWRGFFDYGCGSLGDMACHILGAPNLALRLGPPSSVECVRQDGASPFMFPKSSTVRFDFPARGNMPAVKVFWYDNCKVNPQLPGVPDGEFLGDLPTRPQPPRPPGQPAPAAAPAPRSPYQGRVFSWPEWTEIQPLLSIPKSLPTPNGSLFVGSKGMLTTGTYGESTRLLPVEKMKDYSFPPPLLTRSPGHHRDWIRACKGGDPACSNFDIAAPFTEWILLGVVALRVPGKLEWDSAKMRFTNSTEANRYVKPAFRKGWSIA